MLNIGIQYSPAAPSNLPPNSGTLLTKSSLTGVGRCLPTAKFGFELKLSGPLIRVISTPSLRLTGVGFRLNFGSLIL